MGPFYIPDLLTIFLLFMRDWTASYRTNLDIVGKYVSKTKTWVKYENKERKYERHIEHIFSLREQVTI